MRTVARVAARAAAALVGVLVVPLAVAAPSSAAVPAPEAWQPYPEGPLTLPAADYCGGFALRSTPVRQAVESRVLDRYSSGGIRVEQFRGLLLVDVTNLTTGATVRRDLSGRALVTYRRDGSIITYAMAGPVGLGWPQQDAYDCGFYVMDGVHVVSFDASGARRMVLDLGTEENLCDVVG